jgi:peptide/nickel transport system permease protein
MTTISAVLDFARPGLRTVRRRRLLPATYVAFGLLGLLVLVALVGPFLAPHSPTAADATRRLQAIGSAGHLLGTDGQGRDVLSRLLYGARTSLMTGVVPVAISSLIGTTLGLFAGLAGSKLNALVMRILDVFYAFPTVLLAIAVGAALGPGIRNAMIALSVVFIPPVARLVEGAVAAVRGDDFMEAARSSGASRIRIAVKQVLPNVVAPLVVYCTALIGLSIVEAAGLSFLGLAATPPKAEWGLMLNDGRNYFFTNPGVALVPAVAIFVSSLIFNLAGDRLAIELQVDRKELS